MKKLYSVILIFFVFIAFSNDAISQTKYPPIPEKPDTFKVTKTINLEYKYVPSIKEQIQNGTFIPADPNEFKRQGPPKRMRANKVVTPQYFFKAILKHSSF